MLAGRKEKKIHQVLTIVSGKMGIGFFASFSLINMYCICLKDVFNEMKL